MRNNKLARRQEGPGPLAGDAVHIDQVVRWAQVGHQLGVDPAVIDGEGGG
jgi:hypothetical protein